MTERPETLTEEVTRYVRFDAAHAARVAALAPRVRPHFDRIVAVFYERIREHENAHAVFRDEAQIGRLQRSLTRWLENLFGGRYDAAHFADTARVGQVHVIVGLPQRYMPLAMALIRSEIVRITVAELGAEGAETARSVDLLLDVELTVMMESYRQHFDERIRAVTTGRFAAGADGEVVRRSAQAIELANVVVVGTDAAGSILLFNREAERVTGWARDECTGKNALELLFPDDARPRVRELFLASAAGGKTDVAFHATLSTRSKKTREVRWHLVRAQSVESGPAEAELYFVGHDVTDETRMAERTHRAERLAAVGMLAAGLAHEIRNPLNGAHLHVTFLERSLKKMDAAPDLIDAVATVSSELRRLSSLVTEFLEFARPQTLARGDTILCDVVTRAEAVLRPDAERVGVVLSLDLPVSPVRVLADADKLEQVVLNLARNAVEAFPPGAPGRVTLRVRRTPRRGVIEIEDDGPGLPSEGAPIFDAFYSTKPGGTGLGLPIAHRIVTDHEGSISVESTQGRTVFTVALPIAADAPPEVSSP